MKYSKTILAIAVAATFFVASCRDTPSKSTEAAEEHGHPHPEDDHGHSHDEDGHGHPHDEVEQEEFTIDSTATDAESNPDTHTHDDGSEHHNH